MTLSSSIALNDPEHESSISACQNLSSMIETGMQEDIARAAAAVETVSQYSEDISHSKNTFIAMS